MSKRSHRTASTSGLDERTRLAIALTLTGSGGDEALVGRQDAEARRLGMTGAVIDLARVGRSFDARTSLVLAVALADCGRNEAPRAAQRERAGKAGISAALCDEIEAFVRGIQRACPQ